MLKHQEAVKRMIEEVRLQSESTRTALQSRIDELSINTEETAQRIACITAERDALLAKGGEEAGETPCSRAYGVVDNTLDRDVPVVRES